MGRCFYSVKGDKILERVLHNFLQFMCGSLKDHGTLKGLFVFKTIKIYFKNNKNLPGLQVKLKLKICCFLTV